MCPRTGIRIADTEWKRVELGVVEAEASQAITITAMTIVIDNNNK